jgi:hypothetical protein
MIKRSRTTGMVIASALAGASMLAVGFAGAAQAEPDASGSCESVAVGAPIVVPGDFLPKPISDTRSAGHFELDEAGGLHVYTEDNSGQAKVAEYLAVTPTPLAEAGEPSLAWSGSETPPGFQLIVDLGGDGATDGILVGEPKFYGNRWWANTQLRDYMTAHGGTPPALVGKADGSTVAGTLDAWRATYPDAQVRAIGFSLGSGVKGDGTIASLTFGCETRGFAAATALEFAQTETFGQTVAGEIATATYTVTSGPAGETADDASVIVGIDYVTAAELAGCTVSVDGGPAQDVAITYDPELDGEQYSGALLVLAGDLAIERGATTTLELACQTTAAATPGDYIVGARFDYGFEELRLAAVEVEPGEFGVLEDVLSITPAAVAPSTEVAVAAGPAPSAAPSATTAVLAVTGPEDASGTLRLGLLTLAGGAALLALGAAPLRRSARRR